MTLFYKEILIGYAELLTENSAEKGADIILVIGGDNKSRVPYGVELYQAGFGKKLLFTTPAKEYKEYKFIQSEEEVLKATLDYFGEELYRVPSIKNNGATSTFDEAYDMVAYIKNSSEKINRVIIVTDDYHTGRTEYAFNKIFKLNQLKTTIQTASVPNRNYTIENWWLTENGLQNYIPEGFRFLMYLFISRNLEAIPNV